MSGIIFAKGTKELFLTHESNPFKFHDTVFMFIPPTYYYITPWQGQDNRIKRGEN